MTRHVKVMEKKRIGGQREEKAEDGGKIVKGKRRGSEKNRTEESGRKRR